MVQAIQVRVYDSPEDLPDIRAIPVDPFLANVVKKGTAEGQPTIEIVMCGIDGKPFRALFTSKILRSLHSILEAIDPGGDDREIEVICES